MEEELLTVSEAANKLGVSPRTVQRYCKQGRLNHKWIMGKRHKELRIVPPIPLSQLPGGRRRNLSGTFDYVTRKELEEITLEYQRILENRDRRIALLEEETAELKNMLGGNSGGVNLEKMEKVFNEIDRVRPSETKLLLKLAKEVKEHAEYLKAIGMTPSEND